MLSSITPLGERGRGQRWWLTVSAYIVGSTLGGATVGVLFGTIGMAIQAILGTPALYALSAAVALIGLVSDWRWDEPLLPSLHRQVNEDWLDSFRGWVYGIGFGFQLGVAVVTIIVSGAVHLMLAAAALTASPLLGAVVGAVFGLARGLPVLAMTGVDQTSALVRRHRQMQNLYPVARRAAIAAQAGVFVAIVATA